MTDYRYTITVTTGDKRDGTGQRIERLLAQAIHRDFIEENVDIAWQNPTGTNSAECWPTTTQ